MLANAERRRRSPFSAAASPSRHVDAIEALDKSAVSDAAHTLSEMEVNLVLVAPEGGASGTDTMKEAPGRPGAS
jgi:hypothetical protein